LIAPSQASRGFWPGVALALLPVVLFWEAVRGEGVFFQRDVAVYWLPLAETFVRVVGSGRWPLWDPYEGFGMPLLADPVSQAPYPFTWLALFLRPGTFYTTLVCLHTALSALGFFLLGRRWELSPPAASLSAVIWSSSGPVLSLIGMTAHFCGAAWMPWVLLAIDQTLKRPSLGHAGLLALATGGQVLSGSGDMYVATGLCALVQAARSWGEVRSPARSAATVAVGGVFGLALSAVQWLPTVFLIPSSARALGDPSRLLYWSLHPISLADLWVPRLMSDLPLNEGVRALLYEAREPFLGTLYLGASAAVFAALGLSRQRRGLLAGGAFLFFLILALGPRGGVLPHLVHFPPFSLFRYPVKFMIPAAFFWALLVGLGLERWREDARPGLVRTRSTAVLALLGGVFLLGAASWLVSHPDRLRPFLSLPGQMEPAASAYFAAVTASKLRRIALLVVTASLLTGLVRAGPVRPLQAWVAVLLVSGDIVVGGRGVNALAPPELLAARPPVLRELASVPAPRLYVASEPLAWLNQQFVRGPAGWAREWSWVLGLQEMLQPPIGARWGIRGSYDGDVTGLATPAQSTLTNLLYRARGKPVGLRMLQMASVDYVITLRAEGFEAFPQVAEYPSVFVSPIRLLRVPDPQPEAFVVDGVRVAVEPAALDVLIDPSFDPRREVILESGIPRPPAPDFEGRARVLERRPDLVVIETEASAPALLVLAEAHRRGWKAAVDGEDVEVLKANLLFRGVAVPPGRHRTALRYRPPEVFAGAALSLGAALGGLTMIVVRARRADRE